jgi:carbamoyl-phosphate synthase large subunit
MRAAADINEPDFIFRNHILNEEIIKTDHKNLLCMRYWNEIYVPLNINGEINNNTEGYSLNYF